MEQTTICATILSPGFAIQIMIFLCQFKGESTFNCVLHWTVVTSTIYVWLSLVYQTLYLIKVIKSFSSYSNDLKKLISGSKISSWTPLISCFFRLIMNVSDSSLRNPPQEFSSDTSIIYSIIQHFKVNPYFPEQILSKLLPFIVIYIYATQHQLQTEPHGFN